MATSGHTLAAALSTGLGMLLLALAGSANAADGLVLPGPQGSAEDAGWQWRQETMLARLTIWPAAGTAPDGSNRVSALLVGDAYRWHLRPSWLGENWQGRLRASTGLLLQHDQETSQAAAASSTTRYGLPVIPLGQAGGPSGPVLWPYLGVGYTGLSERSGWGFSADIGLIARPAASAQADAGAGSAPRGEEWSRGLRLDPLLQLGLRYRF